MNKVLPVLLCLLLAGCASAEKKYSGIYNDAVASGHSVVIIKQGDFDTMKDAVDQVLNSVGYNKVLYASPKEPFVVLVRSIEYGSPLLNGDVNSHKIFLKYTKLEAGKTRIDLVNGGTETSARDDIDADIQKLAEMIRNS